MSQGFSCRTRKPGISHRLKLGLFIYPLLPVVPVGEYSEGQNDPAQFGFMHGFNEARARIRMGLQKLRNLFLRRRLPSFARFGAADGDVEVLDSPLPRSAG